MTMSTKDQTIAGLVEASYGYDIPAGYSPEQFFRVQFYSYKIGEAGSNPEVTWVNSIRCKDKYKDSFADDKIKEDEF